MGNFSRAYLGPDWIRDWSWSVEDSAGPVLRETEAH